MGKVVFIHTFGCQMNVHDSEKMAGVLWQEGYCLTDNPKEADLIIYNTCSIRQKAEQKFFSDLGRVKSLKKKNPGLRIAVAGCIAQQQGEGMFKRAPHVDFVFGPQNIHMIPELINGDTHITANDENPEIAETDLPVMRNSGGRAWVTIMYGCDNFCSYCIVPYTRGRERSRPSENILKEIAGLAGLGFKEVHLLGQNVNSYRSDMDFSGLLRRINGIHGIERIRFVTSHPRDLTAELMSAIHELDKVCEHLHLPLQSGSDRILNLMNRGYSYSDYRKKIDLLRNKVPGISITTDIITGFPSETEEDHEKTLEALRDIEFDGMFAFKFSPRSGTEASTMDSQQPEEIKSRRLSEILDLQDSITLKLNKKYENTVQELLAEVPGDTDNKICTGRTRSNKIVNFEGSGICPGDTVKVRVVEAKRHSMIGIMI